MKRLKDKRCLWILFPLSLVGACVDSMMFYPPAASYRDNPNLLHIPLSKEVSVAAVYLPPESETDFVLLFSHGNAEDLGHCGPFLSLCRQHGFGVFSYDYRGYGISGGKATERNTYQDIEAAYDYLTGALGVSPQRILIHGRSIGSGPSVYLASGKPAAGLIIEGGFSYASKVVLPLALPLGPYPNADRLRKVRLPILIIHGTQDSIIPFAHARELYAKANKPKHLLPVEGAGHNDLLQTAGAEYWDVLKQFAERVKKESSSVAGLGFEPAQE